MFLLDIRRIGIIVSVRTKVTRSLICVIKIQYLYLNKKRMNSISAIVIKQSRNSIRIERYFNFIIHSKLELYSIYCLIPLSLAIIYLYTFSSLLLHCIIFIRATSYNVRQDRTANVLVSMRTQL